MSGHVNSSDHDVPMLLSPNMQDWVPEKRLARFIVSTIEQLGLRPVENFYADELQPLRDLRGSGPYKREMVHVRRALQRATAPEER